MFCILRRRLRATLDSRQEVEKQGGTTLHPRSPEVLGESGAAAVEVDALFMSASVISTWPSPLLCPFRPVSIGTQSLVCYTELRT